MKNPFFHERKPNLRTTLEHLFFFSFDSNVSYRKMFFWIYWDFPTIDFICKSYEKRVLLEKNHFVNIKWLVQELPRSHLCFNGISYLNFRKKLLILIEANFLHLLHCSRKKATSQKFLPTPKVCLITLIWIRIEEK